MTRSDAPAPAPLSLGSLILLVLAFGLLAGLGELLLLAWDKFGEGKLVFTTQHVLWLAPLADVIYCGVAGLLLFAVTGGKPSVAAAVSVLGFVAVAAWGFMFPKVYPAAILVISLGVAIQLGKVFAARRDGLLALARAAVVVLGLGWLFAVVATVALGWFGGRAPAPDASPRDGAPNVILITLDTVRAQSLSLYGYQRPTSPVLEQVGARGVVFDTAISTASWTLPAHTSLFTGRFPHETSANWTSALDGSHPTLAEVLRQQGYDTAGFVANLNYCGAEAGLSRGFVDYADYPLTAGQMVLCSSLGRAVTNNATLRGMLDYHENLNRKTAEDLIGEFGGWLDSRGDRPFCAFLNFYDAHQPYLPPGDFAGRFGPEIPRVGFRYDTNLIEIELWTDLTPEQVQMENDSYDAAIAYLDDQLGRLIETLEQRGLMDNTLLVITSDHGEQFGAHELYNHGNSLYTQGVEVPLLMVYPPSVPQGQRVAQAVSLRDVPATILDVVGASGSEQLGGTSLANLWGGGSPQRKDIILSEGLVLEGRKRRGEMKSLVAGNLHYIRNGDGSEELYDITADPLEENDLTLSPSGRSAAATFRQLLDKVVGEQ